MVSVWIMARVMKVLYLSQLKYDKIAEVVVVLVTLTIPVKHEIILSWPPGLLGWMTSYMYTRVKENWYNYMWCV